MCFSHGGRLLLQCDTDPKAQLEGSNDRLAVQLVELKQAACLENEVIRWLHSVEMYLAAYMVGG